MKKTPELVLILVVLLTSIVYLQYILSLKSAIKQAVPASSRTFAEIKLWKNNPSPPKVALQVGHWKKEELPQELEKLRKNEGARYKSLTEWEINYKIASHTAQILSTLGISVELLPATIPPSYKADVFVSIHADQNQDTNRRGFKSSPPAHDIFGKSKLLSYSIDQEYRISTKLPYDYDITPAMTHYYAFSHDRFIHSIHPSTPAVILETGFLTNSDDRSIIVDNPERAAEGIAWGIIEFLR